MRGHLQPGLHGSAPAAGAGAGEEILPNPPRRNPSRSRPREPGTREGTVGALEEGGGVRGPRDTDAVSPARLRFPCFPASVITTSAEAGSPHFAHQPFSSSVIAKPAAGRRSWAARAPSPRAININKLHGSGPNYLPLIVAQPQIQPPATHASLRRDCLVSASEARSAPSPLLLVPPNLEGRRRAGRGLAPASGQRGSPAALRQPSAPPRARHRLPKDPVLPAARG